METKICRVCQQTLELSSFGVVKKTGKSKTYCKACCAKQQAAYHLANRDEQLQKMKVYQLKHRSKLRAKHRDYLQTRRVGNKLALIEWLGGKCVCCAYDKCREAMDFHHIDEKTKCFDIAKFTWKPLEELKIEAGKCVLVCARCHREIHAGITKIPLQSAAHLLK